MKDKSVGVFLLVSSFQRVRISLVPQTIDPVVTNELIYLSSNKAAKDFMKKYVVSATVWQDYQSAAG